MVGRLKCHSVHQNCTSSWEGPSSVAPSTQMHCISLGLLVLGFRKACDNSETLSNILISAECWAGFLGYIPVAFTTPAHSSGVVCIPVNLYDVVCKVDGYLLT